MKKKILLAMVTVISMVLFIDKIEASTFPELTCIYDKTDSQPGIKFTQSKDGNANLYIAPSNASNISRSTNWIFLNKDKIGTSIYETGKNYNKCPSCIKYNSKGGKITDDCSETDGKLIDNQNEIDDSYVYRIVDMSSEIVINEKNQTDDEILDGKWKAKCTYGSDNNKIEIYFTNSDFKMYENNIDITKSVKIGKLTIENKITIDRLNEEYDNYLGEERCLSGVYKVDTKCTRDCSKKKNSRLFATTYSDKKAQSGSSIKYDLIDTNFNTEKNNDRKENINDCEDLFGKGTIDLINEIMKWIRIMVPLLLIVFGILDFSKATFSSGEDNMKKIREKFFRRIIAAILVFLSPIFIKLILKLANSVWGWISPETCIR